MAILAAISTAGGVHERQQVLQQAGNRWAQRHEHPIGNTLQPSHRFVHISPCLRLREQRQRPALVPRSAGDVDTHADAAEALAAAEHSSSASVNGSSSSSAAAATASHLPSQQQQQLQASQQLEQHAQQLEQPADAMLQPAEPQQQQQAQDARGAQPPRVPWGLNVTLTVMFVWLLGFWAAAYLGVPTMLEVLGLDPATGGGRVQAFKHLLLDLLQLAITLSLLRRSLREFRPRQLGMFAVRWAPVRAWLLPLVAGCATFPLIDWVHKQMVALLSSGQLAVHAQQQVTQGTMEQILAAQDWAAHSMWFLVLAVCAPIWEEVMFRGFLLPSLARYLPQWAAVAGTAALFGMVHFTKEGFLPLLLLGCVFGFVYTRTRNLVPPVLLHSAWNVWLLAQILLMGGPA